jgi:serine/threonine-protein phosphatase 6 regulatory ankyrin repeat subunit B
MKMLPPRNLGLSFTVAACISLLLGCSPRTPVLNAAEGGDLEKVKELLRQGHSINERDPRVKFGWTPLIAAIYQDRTNMVHFLIAAGADVNMPDNSGETPIMWATISDDNLGIVEDLIAHGADVNAKDKRGATVLNYAESAPPKPKVLKAVQAAVAKQHQTK